MSITSLSQLTMLIMNARIPRLEWEMMGWNMEMKILMV